MSKTTESTSIEINGVLEKYSIVKMFDFTAERKMMSVVMKRESDGKLLLFTKGADSSVLPLAIYSASGEVAKAALEAGSYAQEGLRTLAFAMRELDLSDKEVGSIDLTELERDFTVLVSTTYSYCLGCDRNGGPAVGASG